MQRINVRSLGFLCILFGFHLNAQDEKISLVDQFDQISKPQIDQSRSFDHMGPNPSIWDPQKFEQSMNALTEKLEYLNKRLVKFEAELVPNTADYTSLKILLSFDPKEKKRPPVGQFSFWINGDQVNSKKPTIVAWNPSETVNIFKGPVPTGRHHLRLRIALEPYSGHTHKILSHQNRTIAVEHAVTLDMISEKSNDLTFYLQKNPSPHDDRLYTLSTKAEGYVSPGQETKDSDRLVTDGIDRPAELESNSKDRSSSPQIPQDKLQAHYQTKQNKGY